MLPTLFVIIGGSAAGKSVLRQTRFEKDGLCYNLRSATTRPMRVEEGESEGNPYFFRDEAYFEKKEEPLATFLWVNEAIWNETRLKENKIIPKWYYGVPEHEILNNLGRNMVYDVIQPRYAADMIKWFKTHKETADYNTKVVWVIPPEDKGNVVQKRANMQNDKKVRDMNTCTALDILRAKLTVDYMLCPRENIYSKPLDRYLLQLYNDMIIDRERREKELLYRNK